ncbi:MAG: hypothetical protein GY870_21935 [archaeon]|nr:hypothetical protein [archaeon]
MAVSLVSDYGIGRNFSNVLSSVDDQRTGFHQSSLSEWNTTTVPVVKEGTRFECNGGLYEVTSDTTIGGSPSDGKVFIYFDESALGFTFTNTAPTWDDDKQGWYVGSSNDRYLPFVVTKSSSSYSDKRIMIVNHPSDRITLEDGADADRELFWASDASILWDESDNEFEISKPINMSTAPSSGSNKDRRYYFASDASILWDESADEFVVSKNFHTIVVNKGMPSVSGGINVFTTVAHDQNDVFDALSPFLDSNTTVMASGEYGSDPISAITIGTTTITIWYGSSTSSAQFVNGSGTSVAANFAICF